MQRFILRLVLVATGILLLAGVGAATEVRYIRDGNGRLTGQLADGLAIHYGYDDGGAVISRKVCRGACFIDAECYEALDNNPGNPCQQCDPETSPVGWAPAHEDVPCDDGDPTTFGDSCGDDGLCSGTPADGPPTAEMTGPGGCCDVGSQAPSGSLLLTVLCAMALRRGWGR